MPTKQTKSRPSLRNVPNISWDLALKRLRRYAEELPKIQKDADIETAIQGLCNSIEIVITDYYGSDSVPLHQFKRIHFWPTSFATGISDSEWDAMVARSRAHGFAGMKKFLEDRIIELEETGSEVEGSSLRGVSEARSADNHTLFVVHGTDHGIKNTVARFLEQLDLRPIILHEQPDQGRTLIEKFEKHAQVNAAVVLLTADDIVCSPADSSTIEKRARQNVILELGFFIGSVGRERTYILYQEGVTLPSDLSGLVYISLGGDWKIGLAREMKAAGIPVDMNRAL